MIHGIYARDLKGEDNFKEVYSQFCVWVKEQVNRFSEAAGVTFYPGRYGSCSNKGSFCRMVS